MHDKNYINQKEEALRQQLSLLTVTEHGVTTEVTPEYVFKHMYAAVVNTDDNKELLSRCPHESLTNLSVIAKSDLGDNRSIFITNEFVQLLRLGAEEIIEYAKSNSFQEGYICCNLAQKVREMIAKDFAAGNQDLLPAVTGNVEEYPVYIVTTPRGIDGASVITSKTIMDEIHVKLDGDYYVLPSSRHEVLVIQADKAPTPEELTHIVTSVNATEVMKCDWLSDDVYYYNGKCLKLADSLTKSQKMDQSVKLSQQEAREPHVVCR